MLDLDFRTITTRFDKGGKKVRKRSSFIIITARGAVEDKVKDKPGCR
jgi:hypothetical protein